MEFQYYKVEFNQSKETLTDSPNHTSICILADHSPSLEEAENLCKKTMTDMGYDTLCSVSPIDYYEANEKYGVNAETQLPFLTNLSNNNSSIEINNTPEDFLKEKYEIYKKNWIEDNVDDILLSSTEACYENCNEISDNTSFEEYVEKFGYADGSCYYSIDEYIVNTLADRIDCYIDEESITELPENLSAYLNKSESDKNFAVLKDILKKGDATPLLDYINEEIKAVFSQDTIKANVAEDIISLHKDLNAVINRSVGIDIENIFKGADNTLSSNDLTSFDNNMYLLDLYGDSCKEVVKRASSLNERLADCIEQSYTSYTENAYLNGATPLDPITAFITNPDISTEFYFSVRNSNGYDMVNLHFCVDNDIDVEIPLSNKERTILIDTAKEYEAYKLQERPYHDFSDLSKSSFFAYNIEDQLYTAIRVLDFDINLNEFPYYDKESRQNTLNNLEQAYKEDNIEAMTATVCLIDNIVDVLSSVPENDYDPMRNLREYNVHNLEYLQNGLSDYIEVVKEASEKNAPHKSKIERE